MRQDYGGQRHNMEDPSMVSTLKAQARIVWPQERRIFLRHAAGAERVLDLACGTGEILRRLAAELSPDVLVGIDLFPGHLGLAPRPVLCGDGYNLPFLDATFDFVYCRHLLQAIDDPVAFLKEARRVLRSGGRIHLLVEDYAALLFDTEDETASEFFHDVTPRFRPQGSDFYEGRRAFRQLREAGFAGITVDPVVVDTLNSDRETFARVLESWRDGYAATLAGVLGVSDAECRRRFDVMASTVRDETRYSAWILFAASGVKDR